MPTGTLLKPNKPKNPFSFLAPASGPPQPGDAPRPPSAPLPRRQPAAQRPSGPAVIPGITYPKNFNPRVPGESLGFYGGYGMSPPTNWRPELRQPYPGGDMPPAAQPAPQPGVPQVAPPVFSPKAPAESLGFYGGQKLSPPTPWRPELRAPYPGGVMPAPPIPRNTPPDPNVGTPAEEARVEDLPFGSAWNSVLFGQGGRDWPSYNPPSGYRPDLRNPRPPSAAIASGGLPTIPSAPVTPQTHPVSLPTAPAPNPLLPPPMGGSASGGLPAAPQPVPPASPPAPSQPANVLEGSGMVPFGGFKPNVPDPNAGLRSLLGELRSQNAQRAIRPPMPTYASRLAAGDVDNPADPRKTFGGGFGVAPAPGIGGRAVNPAADEQIAADRARAPGDFMPRGLDAAKEAFYKPLGVRQRPEPPVASVRQSFGVGRDRGDGQKYYTSVTDSDRQAYKDRQTARAEAKSIRQGNVFNRAQTRAEARRVRNPKNLNFEERLAVRDPQYAIAKMVANVQSGRQASADQLRREELGLRGRAIDQKSDAARLREEGLDRRAKMSANDEHIAAGGSRETAPYQDLLPPLPAPPQPAVPPPAAPEGSLPATIGRNWHNLPGLLFGSPSAAPPAPTPPAAGSVRGPYGILFPPAGAAPASETRQERIKRLKERMSPVLNPGRQSPI